MESPYINELSSLNKEQLMSIINVYAVINESYDMVICEADKNKEEDRFITIDEITNELEEKQDLLESNRSFNFLLYI